MTSCRGLGTSPGRTREKFLRQLRRSWVGGDYSAFPKDPDAAPISYGLVSLAIMLVGFALVLGGHKLAVRRGRVQVATEPESSGTLAGATYDE